MEKKGIGWGFGLLLAALSIFIMVLIGFSFFAAKPEYSITPAIIVLICLLLILALSNSFDNFSIGKLLTISKEAKENKDRAEKLEKEKEELIFKLVNVNFQSQKASSGIFLGDSIAEKLVVQKANSEEIKAEEKEEEKEGEKENSASDNTSKYRFLNRRKYRSLLIKRYFGVSKINLVEEDIKLESQYQDQNIDPISVQPMLFHAHLNDCNQEIFIRIVDVRFSTIMVSHRIYGLLNRIYYYRRAKNNDAYLVLLVANSSYEDGGKQGSVDQLEKMFAPAIASGLLKIQEMQLSKEELETCYNNE